MTLPPSEMPQESGPGGNSLSRSEYAYRALNTAIREGRLPQGARLREAVLAGQLGVSRTPVREALHRLQSRGLLEDIPGRGLIVVEITQARLDEIYHLRELLEGGAARHAALNASAADLNQIDERYAALQAAGSLPENLAAANRRFHDAIADAAHNRHLRSALDDLTDASALLRGTTFSEPTRVRQAEREHKAILDAILARQPDLAEQAAREHVRAAHRERSMMLRRQRARPAQY